MKMRRADVRRIGACVQLPSTGAAISRGAVAMLRLRTCTGSARGIACLFCCVQDGEPLNIVDEVIKSRKRKKKASDEQIDADVYNLIAQVSSAQAGDPAAGVVGLVLGLQLAPLFLPDQ